MNELEKTTKDIELTIMDGLFNYLKVQNYFDDREIRVFDKFDSILDTYDSEDLANELYQRNWLVFENKNKLLEHYPFDVYDIKYLIEKNNLTPKDIFDEETLAKELEKRGWRTLNKEENLELTDFFETDEIIKWVKENCDLYDLVTFDWL